MKPAVELAPDNAAGERQKLLSELFHALSQPITALRCSLELALYDRNSVPSKENLQTALTHAEKIAQLATGIRELIVADDPGDERSEISLEEYLREALAEMHPIAEAAQVAIHLDGTLGKAVISEPRRLRQALFYWLEFAVTSAIAHSTLDLKLEEQAGRGVVTLMLEPQQSQESLNVSVVGEESKSQKLSRRLGLAIAGRIFESAGGGAQVQEDEHHLRLRFYLPLAS